MIRQINKSIIKVADFIEKQYRIFFTLILILAIFLNLYKFGEIPNEIHVDEAGMTYDAYSIANYGTDRFEKKLPVYFINFGGGQNALYTYLTAILIKLFGSYNSLIIRIPSFIISIIEIIVAYLLVKDFKSKKQALLFMLLVTIAPWHIMKSRWGLESFLLSPLFLFSIFALTRAIRAEKMRMFKFLVSGLLFGVTLYTYAISYIVVPIFLILIGLYLIKLRKIHVKDVFVFFIPLIILAIPLVLMLMVQKGWINEIDSFITIPKLFEYRQSEISFDIKNILSIRYGLFCDYLGYNSLKGYGTLYYIGTILMCIGIIIAIIDCIKNKSNQLSLDVIMLIAFISNFIMAFFIHINSNVINGILISATFFELITLRTIYQKAKVPFGLLLIIYMFSFILFMKAYFTEYPKQYKRFHDNGAIEVIAYIQERFKDVEIYMDGKYNTYIYSLYVNPITPQEFNQSKEMKDGEVSGYKNYHAYFPKDNNYNENSVYITLDKNKVVSFAENKDYSIEIFKNYYIMYIN